ncbi:hypothetical protein [Acinetobacter haemolyticus]|uniref:Uncharacterized protein n=1 Tax=Acinetobacter haemolyticus TaxID=29430 RepID=A0A4P7B762_ACIHA|nr:hypothetical protein [Acinetobacter haemolyticus]QBQ16270.1 hypothetical protein AHTJR_08250 [Acinetobacter haemolyticus]
MSAIQEFTFFFLPESYPRREARIYFQEDTFFWEIILIETITYSGEIVAGNYAESGNAETIEQAYQDLFNCMCISIDKNINNTDLKIIEIKNHSTSLISLNEQKILISDEAITIS